MPHDADGEPATLRAVLVEARRLRDLFDGIRIPPDADSSTGAIVDVGRDAARRLARHLERLVAVALVVLVFVGGCVGCEPPPPCASGTCYMDPSGGPAGWQDAATAAWGCYGDDAPAPPLDVVHWVARGDCVINGVEGVETSAAGCCRGATGIALSPIAPPVVHYIYVLDGAIEDGSLSHELLHAWISMTRREDDGDPEHHRPEWTSLYAACLPSAQ